MTQLVINVPDIATLGKIVQALAPLGVLGNAPGAATTATPAATPSTVAAAPAAAPADPFASSTPQVVLPTWDQFIARAQAWTKIGNNAAEFVGKLNAFGAANGVAVANVPALQPMGPEKWAQFLATLPGA